MHGLSTTVGDAGPERDSVPPHAVPEALVRELSGGAPTPAQQATLDRVAATDWRTTALVLGNTADETYGVIKSADWLIDLGPERGSGGGYVIAEGTPEQVAAAPASFTGECLRPVLEVTTLAAD